MPPGYDAAENRARRYPVLYMLDGQNLFDACLSDVSHHEWTLDETVYQSGERKKIPAMIVVGVDHAGKDRAHEYLPYKDYVGNPDMAEPAGKRFPDFMTSEVMPLIDGKYRTLQGHPNTAIGGSSYGGVATLYALMAKPIHFGYGLIESPTMWVGMGQLVRDTSPLIAMPEKVFVAFGGKEADNPAGREKMIGLDPDRRIELPYRGLRRFDLPLRAGAGSGAHRNGLGPAVTRRAPVSVQRLERDSAATDALSGAASLGRSWFGRAARRRERDKASPARGLRNT